MTPNDANNGQCALAEYPSSVLFSPSEERPHDGVREQGGGRGASLNLSQPIPLEKNVTLFAFQVGMQS